MAYGDRSFVKSMVKYVCDNCDEIDETNTRVEERRETYNVKGEPVTVLANVRVRQQMQWRHL